MWWCSTASACPRRRWPAPFPWSVCWPGWWRSSWRQVWRARQLAALGLGSAFVCLSLLSSGAGTGLWALWALLLLLQGLRPVAASGPIPALSWSDRLGGALGASLLLVMLLLPAILPWDRGPSRDLADGVSPPLTGEEDDDEGCEDDDDRCEDDDDDRCEEDDDDLPLQLEPGQEAIVL